MKIDSNLSDDALLSELGARITRVRLERNLTQAQLATEAGVSKRTVERLESGAVGTHLSGFIRILRVLDLLGRIELLVPEPVPSPMTLLKLQGRIRRRASGQRVAAPPTTPGKWTWGDPT